ncbi:MAG: c-type cytochrome [Halothiobacillus sp.]|jgi:cytochrome c553|nr:c-type cytochrome [Halothiobacillus sp.]
MDSAQTSPRRPSTARSRINVWLLCSTTLTTFWIGPYAHAQPGDNLGQLIAEKGLHHIPACAVCHGENGEGNLSAGYPRLAGMSKAYLFDQMNDYASGARHNRAMQRYSHTLTFLQRKAVAGFYAAKPGLQPSTLSPPSADNPNLVKLMEQGDWSREIPSCFSCHGVNGAGTPLIPAIAQQPAQYVITQMNHWQTDARPVVDGDPMAIIAKHLSTTEIADIARYLAHNGTK